MIQNAKIDKVSIEIEHDSLSAWLFLILEDGNQGFGGYSLNKNLNFIRYCMEIGDVIYWEKLPGKTIRVYKESFSSLISGMGHIIKNKWYFPKNINITTLEEAIA